MSKLDRRDFLRSATALGAHAFFAPSLLGLSAWNGRSSDEIRDAIERRANSIGYGELKQSPDCPDLWIPEGFRAMRLSTSHEESRVNPGFNVPVALDGMAAFPLPNGNIRLIRNHEIGDPASRAKPFGRRPYDTAGPGGTTSLEVRVQRSGDDLQLQLLAEYPSITGTLINCAGGRTPWGSWLTCEETTQGTTQGYTKPHGYVFEVPAGATEEVDPQPIKAMGRFVHEAVAVDARTGIVYLTEDVRYNPQARLPGAGFYRYIPNRPGEMLAGGKLQILGVRGERNYNTVKGQTPGASFETEWFDIDEPDSPAAERDPSHVFRQGLEKGAAIFHRLEGCFAADDSIYFDATEGGDAGSGQVWQFRPTGHDTGVLTLVFESPGKQVLHGPDNICIGPRGGVVICEDTDGDHFLRGLTPKGEMINIVHVPPTAEEPEPTEFAGCCFSPDYSVLFFNRQGATRSYNPNRGATYALWGPWERADI